MQPSDRRGALAEEAPQQRGRLRRPFVDDQPLRRAPPPDVRLGEHRDPLGGRGLARPARGRRRRTLRLRGDAVDPAAVAAAIQIGRIVMVVGHPPLRVLDQRPVVVDHVERAVGTGGEVDGAEPGVARGQELPALLRAARDEGRAGR